jgi:hypothetical protein
MQDDPKRSLKDDRHEVPAADSVVGASEYVRQNYEPVDRLAIVIRNRVTGQTIQRLASAEKIASGEFQSWLRYKNARGGDIYISQNALRAGARTRTKSDIEKVRHLYMDVDRNGDEALERIQRSHQVPEPNYVISTSPRKYQVIWKVEGIAPTQAEAIQKAMVEQFDGDPAATDSTRALRLPGFNNKKYGYDYSVTARTLSNQTYSLADFRLPTDGRAYHGRATEQFEHRSGHTGEITQSERDWAYAKRHLTNDESPEALIQLIAHFRQDKPNPDYYSRQTVTRAYASVALSRGDSPTHVRDRVAQLSTHRANPVSYAQATIAEIQGRMALSESEPERSAPQP